MRDSEESEPEDMIMAAEAARQRKLSQSHEAGGSMDEEPEEGGDEIRANIRKLKEKRLKDNTSLDARWEETLYKVREMNKNIRSHLFRLSDQMRYFEGDGPPYKDRKITKNKAAIEAENERKKLPAPCSTPNVFKVESDICRKFLTQAIKDQNVQEITELMEHAKERFRQELGIDITKAEMVLKKLTDTGD